MRRIILGLSLALAVVGFVSLQVSAQETKSARGTVTAMSADSMTVKAGDKEMKFTVDAKTIVTAEGAGAASREAAAAGKAGPKLADVVKVGNAVEVSYHEVGGALHATRIRRTASVGSGGGGVTSDEQSDTSNGTVQSVTPSSLTISGSSGGGAKFTQTFSVDTNTRVIGEGMGTAAAAAAAKGTKTGITSFLAAGDQVSVTYRKKGDSLIATQVRVTRKGK